MIDFPSDFSPDTALPIPLATRFISAEVSFFAPAIDKFVALINVIGKAFAVLTGKSVYIQAKKHAVDSCPQPR